MRFVSVKSPEQQAVLILNRTLPRSAQRPDEPDPQAADGVWRDHAPGSLGAACPG